MEKREKKNMLKIDIRREQNTIYYDRTVCRKPLRRRNNERYVILIFEGKKIKKITNRFFYTIIGISGGFSGSACLRVKKKKKEKT